MNSATLFLIPVPLGDEPVRSVIPDQQLEIIRGITCFIAEDTGTAMGHLKRMGHPGLSEVEIHLLNEHTTDDEVLSLAALFQAKLKIGLMSEAGTPAVADPGAELVKLAHERGVKMVPMVGPSAILIAAMSAGFNGQSFAFNGYLPHNKDAKRQRVAELERLSCTQAQYFIEAPYRNQQLFEYLLSWLAADTRVYIGRSLLSSGELILTRTVHHWKQSPLPDLHKQPVIFGIQAMAAAPHMRRTKWSKR